MRSILWLTIIFLTACENKKKTIVNRQQAIKNEMGQVKVLYYKKTDSLESIRGTDTMSGKEMKIMKIAEAKKTASLLSLQKEYDSLEGELKNY